MQGSTLAPLIFSQYHADRCPDSRSPDIARQRCVGFAADSRGFLRVSAPAQGREPRTQTCPLFGRTPASCGLGSTHRAGRSLRAAGADVVDGRSSSTDVALCGRTRTVARSSSPASHSRTSRSTIDGEPMRWSARRAALRSERCRACVRLLTRTLAATKSVSARVTRALGRRHGIRAVARGCAQARAPDQ